MSNKINKITIPILEQFTDFMIANRRNVTPNFFADEFNRVKWICLQELPEDVFCTEAGIAATKLVETENTNFAGIIMSSLCKLVESIPELLEPMAIQGYEISKINGDTIHMLSRLNDLRKIYLDQPDKLYQYIKVLYKEEKCLKELVNNYEKATKSYKTLTRRPATLQEYEQMLGFIQTEIGKLTRRKHPIDALEKLISAREIFVKRNNTKHVAYIDLLIKEIEQNISHS
ncbi:MAG: hypothetical protein ACI37Q_05685 [Candidatus Gastranaerophilaceae bacterium]